MHRSRGGVSFPVCSLFPPYLFLPPPACLPRKTNSANFDFHVVLIAQLFSARENTSSYMPLDLQLSKLADFVFLPSALKRQDFLPLSLWPTSKSQLCQFSLSALADCTGVFSTSYYPYLHELKNDPFADPNLTGYEPNDADGPTRYQQAAPAVNR